MSTSSKLGASLIAFFSVVVVACGSSSASDDGSEAAPGSSGSPAGTFGSPPPDGGTPDEVPIGDFEKCATSSAKADASPAYLVFMFDRSGSMVVGDRWSACKSATEAFFESPDSAGLTASLHYFPLPGRLGGLVPNCDASAYAKPEVPMTSLPNATFKSSLDKQQPTGVTPTGPALSGAVQYAQQIAQGPAKNGKVAIVLVSDGDPEGCGENMASVSQIASGVAQKIPTYVIGVGDVNNLHAIAKAGGTNQAFIVPAGDPSKIQADFRAAIGAIRLSAVSCDYTIPAPPKGEKLDRDKVNVIYQSADGKKALAYNQSCNGGKGWRYDDQNAPKRILICGDSCETIKSKPGNVDVVFGCETRVGGVK